MDTRLLHFHECPSCHGALVPRKLVCTACDLSLEGPFSQSHLTPSSASNEFASLPDEDLHLLRIFVHCEGSIRQMESALGLSYPTIKSRLARLRQRLKTEAPQPNIAFASIEDVLAALERGEITAADSVELIRKMRGV
jgi:hypothetical protein